MNHLTVILQRVERGEAAAANELLPLIYDELRKLAAMKMAREQPGQTLQPTALVHEAYLRLLGQENQGWQNSRHFFTAAAEAMRRILVERARRKARHRHGGGMIRLDIERINVASEDDEETLLFVNDALEKLASKDPVCAELINLRFFAGVPNHEAARLLGLSERTAKRDWAYARAWLTKEIERLKTE
jgi:RNA polymerase sigma factor (TIGR02999 family)